MSDPRELLEEYLDGLLPEEECLKVEAALARDPALREEMDRVRRFDRLMRGLADPAAESAAVARIVAAAERMERRRTLWLRIVPLAAAASLLVAVALAIAALRPPPPVSVAQLTADWVVYGKRLGLLALERRAGKVPRIGLEDLEVPPARASGIVFSAALGVLGEPLDPEAEDRVARLVSDHAEAMRRVGEGVEAECRRSEASLSLYRDLRSLAGARVADAWYDVFRPGLADLPTARRVPADALDRVAAEAYVRAYQDALGDLERRYGGEKVATVLDHLAPADARDFRRDASQEGVGRDAVLAIRARMYQTALEQGADRLYVALH